MKTGNLIILLIFAAFMFQLEIKANVQMSMARNGLQQCVDKGQVVWKQQCEPTVKKIFKA